MPTHRKAPVIVVNNTGKQIRGIDVVHKYSDNYINKLSYGDLSAGQSSSSQQVDYNTGFGVTGRDWWLITWMSDEKIFYYTAPENFRGIFDALEGGIVEIVRSLPAAEPIEKVAKEVAAQVLSQFVNDGKTAGFKQHILRSEDQDQPTRIELSETGVKFVSKSGDSSTNFKSKEL